MGQEKDLSALANILTMPSNVLQEIANSLSAQSYFGVYIF